MYYIVTAEMTRLSFSNTKWDNSKEYSTLNEVFCCLLSLWTLDDYSLEFYTLVIFTFALYANVSHRLPENESFWMKRRKNIFIHFENKAQVLIPLHLAKHLISRTQFSREEKKTKQFHDHFKCLQTHHSIKNWWESERKGKKNLFSHEFQFENCDSMRWIRFWQLTIRLLETCIPRLLHCSIF